MADSPSLLPRLPLYLIVRKASRRSIRLCDARRRRWRLSYVWQVLAMIVALVMAFAAPALFPASDTVAGPCFFALRIAAVVTPVLVSGRARVGASSIDDGYVHLDGVSPELARSLGVPPEA